MCCGFEARLLGSPLYIPSKSEFICYFCHKFSMTCVHIATALFSQAKYESSYASFHCVQNWPILLVSIDESRSPSDL